MKSRAVVVESVESRVLASYDFTAAIHLAELLSDLKHGKRVSKDRWKDFLPTLDVLEALVDFHGALKRFLCGDEKPSNAEEVRRLNLVLRAGMYQARRDLWGRQSDYDAEGWQKVLESREALRQVIVVLRGILIDGVIPDTATLPDTEPLRRVARYGMALGEAELDAADDDD